MTNLPVPSYMEFFNDDYLGAYRETISPENAVVESAFVHRVLQLPRDAEVLDLCCGHGRHAVILALTGLRVTGLDLSDAYLERAAAIAAEAGVNLPLVRSDMREIPFEGRFDAVINIFTSFGYLNSDSEDMKVLHQVARALKPGGQFLIDLINREWVVSNYVRDERKVVPNGTVYQERREIDLLHSRINNSFWVTTPDGTTHHTDGLTIRLYSLTELVRMLNAAGLAYRTVYGGYELEPYDIESRRMIVVADKAR
ncbi:MAG: class I SAM-dependent methyltransferase [Chloroflexota bacterium]|nr:class I SAM-dependent methyltransferase [Chloroflexota bacterium]